MLLKYFTREILAATVVVLLALLSLFAFFDMIRELDELGHGNYRLTAILGYVLLTLPTHTYVLLPLAGLMGTLFALARMSENSEITVMRASGLSLRQLALNVAFSGAIIALATLAFGELVAPHTEEAAKGLKLKATRSIVAREFRSGFWVKDDRSFVNIQDVTPDTQLLNLRIYEFDPSFRLLAISRAERGTYEGGNRWSLSNVELTRFEGDRAVLQRIPKAVWNSVLTPDILSVLKIVPERMSALNLRGYIEHLRENRQNPNRYEIAFFGKFFNPLAAVVMMVLAIPFALVSARAGGVGAKLFMGIMLGLVFNAATRMFAHVGLLNDWPPLVSSSAPVLIAAIASLWLLRGAEKR
jgi:lipopolysaccharide export system permease protein